MLYYAYTTVYKYLDTSKLLQLCIKYTSDKSL